MNKPAPEKLEKLRKALENFESGDSGGGLFDEQLETEKSSVRSRALLLLDQRGRSRQELRHRLLRLDFAPEIVDEVLDDLERVRLIDDFAFAQEWVRQRHAAKGKSAAVLEQELVRKGVGEAARNQALEQVTAESEEEIAWKLARKKARSIKEIPQGRQENDKVLRRVVGVLARRGFSMGVALPVAKEAISERCQELS
ncbi:recombinase RecX [Corynebacterium phocae]|uniref:Regulatory protein RecX n=1 Tax=Corynebacterium phocae TaxID=161895 RepID=A0A1L7D2H4_9CORY|nr:recombination regulator RecX [Corynebacterium phocae]APT92366.1 recombinase RecX [Corynebacterium phocae]KAA8724957.1 recombination regulator RecX [Corynebacterium phocae]